MLMDAWREVTLGEQEERQQLWGNGNAPAQIQVAVTLGVFTLKDSQTVHSWLYFKLQYLTKTTAANTQGRMARVSPLSPGIHPLQVALCLCPAGAVSVHSFHCFFLLIRFHRFPLFCPSLSLWTWHSDPDPSSTCVALGADFSFSASVSVFH